MKNDKYKQLKDQVENILEFCDKVSEINPDHELYCDGRDVYICHVEEVLSEVKDIIKYIEEGKEPIYTKEWINKSLKEVKENYC